MQANYINETVTKFSGYKTDKIGQLSTHYTYVEHKKVSTSGLKKSIHHKCLSNITIRLASDSHDTNIKEKQPTKMIKSNDTLKISDQTRDKRQENNENSGIRVRLIIDLDHCATALWEKLL